MGTEGEGPPGSQGSGRAGLCTGQPESGRAGLHTGQPSLRDVLFSSLLLQSITKQVGFQIVVVPAANESNLALDHRVNKLSTLYFRA